MGVELRADQHDLIAELDWRLDAGKRRIAIQAPTGYGKTILAGALVDSELRQKHKTLFVVPALELIDQTIRSFQRMGIEDIGVIQGMHEMSNWDMPVQVCSVQTLMRRTVPKDTEFVIIDECFAAGTMISTPYGERAIEKIGHGDIVTNATGYGVVTGVMRQKKSTIRIGLSNGREIRVTDNHPFFTEDGWKKAGELEVRTRLFSTEAVRALWRRDAAKAGEGRSTVCRVDLEKNSILQHILLQESREPYLETGRGREAFQHTQKDWSSPCRQGRQRAWLNQAAADVIDPPRRWLGAGIADINAYEERQRLSFLLQGGYSQPIDDDCNRGRWTDTQQPQGPNARQEEIGVLGDVRVVSISREERRCDQDVFNLSVSGHPSYFAGGVLVHNCHQWFQFYGKWMLDPEWSHVPFIGLSATPWRKGLGAYFTDLIIASTTQQMIDAGLLSDFKVYAPSSPDLKGVRTIAGDYHEGELAERMNTAPLVADVVSTWLAKGENRPTLCFAVDRAHAKHLQQQFEAQGVKAAYMDAYTKDEERTLIRGRFHSGEIKVVCNVGVLTTGVDWDVRCIVMARPTKSEMLFVQIIGRGLRTAEGKDYCLILDHSDNHLRLGFVTDIHHTQLHDGKSPLAAKAEQIALPKKCPECSYLKPPKTPVCPACGFKAEAFDKAKVVDGELIQLDRKTKQPLFELESQQNFYRELLWYGRMKGYAKGWSYHKYMERFKSEPAREWERLEPKEATMTTMKWITSRNIRWARSRFNADARHTQQSTRPVAGDTPPPWDSPDLFER